MVGARATAPGTITGTPRPSRAAADSHPIFRRLRQAVREPGGGRDETPEAASFPLPVAHNALPPDLQVRQREVGILRRHLDQLLPEAPSGE